ncbi:MAG: prolyl oligopeptidase family serine peptidase [Ktedonobacteraceae bacterium]|nr:prolyl oligopeptidase family serine peptidase [Ktedonobacteraceae bacterium]
MHASGDFGLFEPFVVTYPSASYALRGYLLLPIGQGPFPAVIFQHGSAGLLPSNKQGIEALRRMGYAVFVALRRGHNGNPGPHWLSLVSSPWGSPEMGGELVNALNGETDDVLASLDWLCAQPQIDPDRIALAGSSFGGVVTILAAGRTSQFRAGISFAGPSQTWPHASALQEAMIASVQKTPLPFFLLQAQNDHSLLPTYMLGAEFARLNKPHETRIYPALGTTPMEGHGIFGGGVAWWYADVERFLAQWL